MSTITRAGQANADQAERAISTISGALLALMALRRAPWPLALAALGGLLLYRGMTGRWPSYSYLGISPAEAPPRPSEELVDQTIEESFPASDPPGWHAGSSFTQASE